jgi:chemotaxis protein MotB
MVEGHTDDVQIVTPRFPTNWDLAAARAVSVIKHLTGEGGIAAYRFAAVSYGSSRPLAPNDTPEGRAMNRRVDVVLVGIDPVVLSQEPEEPIPAAAGADTGTDPPPAAR